MKISPNYKNIVKVSLGLLFLAFVFYFNMCGTPDIPVNERVLLPSNVKPVKYDITLTPDLQNFTFSGLSLIEVDVTKETETISIHAVELVVKTCTIDINGEAVEMVKQTADKESETITFDFGKPVNVGKHFLTIVFDGILNDQMCGFYRSKYKKNGEEKYCAVTQFEPTDARRAFPCFDEPALKAKFTIRLVVPQELVALSNMPILSTAVQGDKKTVVYEETPIMSTYLVAFVVGEFDYVEGKSEKGGVTVRVFTEVGKSEQGKFALDCACKILDFYDDYFDIKYPLEKADMIAISDFSAGAMENWGLITYRETALLIDESSSSLLSKQRVAYVVAHELAHQWFGNLVTMDWWQDLWLNEGFATWVGNLAVDFLFKEWDIWTQFVQQYVARAMDLDALESSHPIEVDVRKSSEVNEIFDAISYCKGASVIRMLAEYIGLENFKNGLRIYLKRHKYANAATKDLWIALGESSKMDVASFMQKWTRDIGYPVVSLSRPSENTVTVSQKRFLSSGKQVESDPWKIPFSLRGDSSSNLFSQIVEANSETVKIPVDMVASKWLKANLETNGFYRTSYDDAMLDSLGSAVESGTLPVLDRLAIVNDAFALSKAGYLSVDKVLSLVSKFKNEDDYTVWAELNTNLGKLKVTFGDHESADKIKPYILNLYETILGVLGWDPKDGENALYSVLRPIIIQTVGLNGHEATISEAQKRFATYLDTPESLLPDLRGAVYSIVVAHGDKKDYDAVKNIFKTADMHEERIRALRSLGCTQHVELINDLLEMGQTEEVRSSDVFYIYELLGKSKIGRPIAWDFMRNNFGRFEERFGTGQFLFGRMINMATGNFASKERALEIGEFFKANPVEQAARTIEQSIESVNSNAAWIERGSKPLSNFFA